MLPLHTYRETDRLAGNLFKHFCQCLKEMGQPINLRKSLQQLGIVHAKHTPDTAELNLTQYYQLLEAVAPQLQNSVFFLRLGSAFDLTDAGVLGYASLSVENLRQSWELTSQSNPLYPHPLTGRRRVEQQRVITELPAPAHSRVDPRYLQEEWLASTWQWMCQRLPQIADSRDLQLKLSYPAPTYRAAYKEIFPGKVLFGQSTTEMSFPENWYDLPFPAANPATAQLCQEQCRLIMAQLENQTDLIDQVRRLLLLSPQRQFPSQESVAEHFQLPPHTFHRRLKKAGTSYRHIVNEVRMELARDYVGNTDLPLQEISYLLGYDYPPNFYRAFKTWFSVTADQLRQQSNKDR